MTDIIVIAKRDSSVTEWQMPMGTRIPHYKLYRKVKSRCRNGKPTDMTCNVKYHTGEGKHSGKWLNALGRRYTIIYEVRKNLGCGA